MLFVFSDRSLRTPGLLLGSALLGICLALGGVESADAQVALELHRRIDAPGEDAVEGRPLPPRTTALVIPHRAEQPHTLENAGTSREDLSRLVLERLRVRDDAVQVTERGRTDQAFPTTSESGELLYVVARTPSDSLYESYVYTGEGFVPGFDAVESGRMTMGPVPPEAARRYRATFRRYREETGGAARAETEPDAREDARASGERDMAGPATSQAQRASETNAPSAVASDDSLPLGGPWSFLLGALLGGALGGGLGWYLYTERIEELEVERNRLQRQTNRQKNAEFRETAGVSQSNPEDESGDSRDSETEGLQEENEKLREENQVLRDEIHQIRRYVETLHEERT